MVVKREEERGSVEKGDIGKVDAARPTAAATLPTVRPRTQLGGQGSSRVRGFGADWHRIGAILTWEEEEEEEVQSSNMFYLVIVAVILCILFKILNVNNSAEKSIFYCKNQKFLEEFLKRAPELELPYVPTRFWGFSGHIQTIIQVCILFLLFFQYRNVSDGVLSSLCW